MDSETEPMPSNPLWDQPWRDSLRQIKSTQFCRIYGHSKVTTGKADNFYQDLPYPGRPGVSRKLRQYFKGELFFCKNPKCEWKQFAGEKDHWRMTLIEEGVEYELKPKETVVGDDGGRGDQNRDVGKNA